MAGIRVDPGGADWLPSSYDLANLSPEAEQKRRLDQIMATAVHGGDSTPYLTPPAPPAARPVIQGPTLDLSTDLPALDARPDPGVMRFQSLRSPQLIREPMRQAIASFRRPSAKPAAPSRTERALTFAKALGFVGEEAATPEYAEAAARAFAKMTKGMSVAKLLSASRRAKAQDEFQRLVEAEAAKVRSGRPTPGGKSTPSII